MPRGRLLFIASLLALALPAHAQEQVAGKVVSQADGRPLARAVVTLTNIKRERLAATATADGEGHFRFDPVAPGKYRLTGSAAHFLSGLYLGHDQYSTAIVTGAGLATGDLVLQLTPASTISGHILDDAGEPMTRALVTLYREDSSGSERVKMYRSAQTEDDGAYEFTNLPRGHYFLSASGTPWYAVRPIPEAVNINAPYRTVVDPALDVAYPTVFYPDVLDSDRATVLTIEGGEQLTANLQMHAQHAVELTIRLAPGQKINQRMPQLTQSIFGMEQPIMIQAEYSEGMQRLVGIPPGRYNLQEISSNGISLNSTPIDLTAASSVATPRVPDLATVTVAIHPASGTSLPAQLQVSLRVPHPPRGFGGMFDAAKGSAEFAQVPPGDYVFSMFSGAHTLTVLDMTFNGQHVADKRLHIAGGGSVTASVTASATAVEVEGFARRDGKPAAGSMVVLVPAGAYTGEELFRRDQSDLDGSFTFHNVVPGNYILIAIDDGWPLRWTDTAALAPYLMHGLPVSISSTASSTIPLADAVATQPR